MSFVSVIATTEFISFVSDGRVTDTEKDIIVNESTNKVKKSESIIFSVTGNAAAGRVLFENYHLYNRTNAKAFALNVFNNVGKGATDKAFHVLVGGLDADNKIFFTGFDSQKTITLEYIYPDSGQIRFATSGNVNDIELDINTELLKSYQQHNRFNILDAKKVQEKINLVVSKQDKTVNNRTFHEALLKPFK